MMNNRQLADIFTLIADLLEIKGEIIYKTLAYRKASESLMSLGREASEYWKEGKLLEIPGVGKAIKDIDISDDAFKGIEAIINSMTRKERREPGIIDGSRRARIAKGSGSDPGEVGQLVKQFKEMQKLMKRMPGLSGTKKARGGKGKKAKAPKEPKKDPVPFIKTVKWDKGKVVPGEDPMGRKHFWFTVVPLERHSEGTDLWAIQQGYVSITPLQCDTKLGRPRRWNSARSSTWR